MGANRGHAFCPQVSEQMPLATTCGSYIPDLSRPLAGCLSMDVTPTKLKCPFFSEARRRRKENRQQGRRSPALTAHFQASGPPNLVCPVEAIARSTPGAPEVFLVDGARLLSLVLPLYAIFCFSVLQSKLNHVSCVSSTDGVLLIQNTGGSVVQLAHTTTPYSPS